jgi:hypothetical protein
MFTIVASSTTISWLVRMSARTRPGWPGRSSRRIAPGVLLVSAVELSFVVAALAGAPVGAELGRDTRWLQR